MLQASKGQILEHISKVEESRSLDIHSMTVCYTCCCGALLCTAVPLATAVCVLVFVCLGMGWASERKKYKNETEVSSPLVKNLKMRP